MPKRKTSTRASHAFKYPMQGCKPPGFEKARLSAAEDEITLEKLQEFSAANPGVDSDTTRCIEYARSWMSGKPQIIKGLKNCPANLMETANQDDNVLFFVKFCKDTPKYADLFATRDGLVPVITLQVDTYKLWDAIHDWWKHRCSYVSGNLDNGWFRHSVRLMARYQEFTLLGVQGWWRDDSEAKTSRNPTSRKKARVDTVSDEQNSIAQDASIISDAEDDSPTRDASPFMPRNTQSKTERSPCMPSPTRPSPSASCLVLPPVPRASAPAATIVTAPKKRVSDTVKLSHQQQLACYLGFNVNLLAFARAWEETRIKKHKGGGITTSAVRTWLLKHPEFIPDHLRNVEWQVDHIISDSIGGIPWIFNYFIMPKEVNNRFKELMDADKRTYVGATVFSAAKSFARWYRQKSLMFIRCGRYDPKFDFLQGRA